MGDAGLPQVGGEPVVPHPVQIHGTSVEDYLAVLDILIFVAYVTIPVQLVLLLLRPTFIMDYSKFSETFSVREVFHTRLLAACFALFIVFCGIGHSMDAMAGSMCYTRRLPCSWLVVSKTCTCLASCATSVVLLAWTPSLTNWMGDVEIQRKGFTTKVYEELQEAGTVAGKAKGLANACTSLRRKLHSKEKEERDLEGQARNYGKRAEMAEQKVKHQIEQLREMEMSRQAFLGQLKQLMTQAASSNDPRTAKAEQELLQLMHHSEEIMNVIPTEALEQWQEDLEMTAPYAVPAAPPRPAETLFGGTRHAFD